MDDPFQSMFDAEKKAPPATSGSLTMSPEKTTAESKTTVRISTESITEMILAYPDQDAIDRAWQKVGQEIMGLEEMAYPVGGSMYINRDPDQMRAVNAAFAESAWQVYQALKKDRRDDARAIMDKDVRPAFAAVLKHIMGYISATPMTSGSGIGNISVTRDVSVTRTPVSRGSHIPHVRQRVSWLVSIQGTFLEKVLVYVIILGVFFLAHFLS